MNKIAAENIVEGNGYSIIPHYEDHGFSPNINRPVDEDSCNQCDNENVPPKCSLGILSESSSDYSQGSSNDPSYKPRRNLKISKIDDVKPEVREAIYNLAKAAGIKFFVKWQLYVCFRFQKIQVHY